ncbi:MAG: tetratricopeptide repeat protein [Cyclobacteriaceae bacterium]|nr:tetratricopeptide repeat protein [Cyclobacteriaceae bacterium]
MRGLKILLLTMSVSPLWAQQDSTDLYKQALSAFQKQDYQQSILLLDRVVRKDTGRLDARIKRIAAQYALGQYEDAGRDLTHLISQQSKEPEIGYWAGLTLFKLGRRDTAKVLLDRAIQGGIQRHEGFLRAGQLHTLSGNYPKALTFLDKAVKEKPDAETLQARGELHLLMGNQSLALADFDKSIIQEANHPKALSQRSALLQQKRDWKGVQADLERLQAVRALTADEQERLAIALFENGNYVEATKRYAALRTQSPLSQEGIRAWGLSLIRLKSYAEAIETLSQLPEGDRDGQWQEAYALALLKTKQTEKAHTIVNQIKGELSPVALFVRGACNWYAHDVIKSKIDLEKAKAGGYSDGELYWLLGRQAMDRKEWKAAVDLFTQAIPLDPSESTVYYYRGVCNQQLGRSDDALDDYQICLSRLPNMEEARKARGQLHFKLRHFAAAIEDLDRVSLGVDSVALLRMLGLSRLDLGEREAAGLLLERVLRAGAGDAEIKRAVAYLRFDRMNYEGTLQLLTESPADANDARFYYSRGLSAYHTGNDAMATHDLSKAATLGNQSLLLRETLGLSFARLKQPGESLKWLRLAVTGGSKSREVTSALARMLFESGALRESLSVSDSAIRLGGGDATLYLYRGKAHLSLKEPRQSVEDFNSALQYQPDLAEAYRWRARAQASLENWSNVIVDVAMTGAYSPLTAEDHATVGRAHLALKDYSSALRALTESVKAGSATAETLANRASAYAGTGDWLKAIQDWDKALVTNPRNAQWLAERGDAYLQAGQKSQACASWKSAAQAGSEMARKQLSTHCVSSQP